MNPKDQYNEFGYCILRAFFDSAEIALLDQYVDRIYQKWMQENEADILNNKLVNMHSLTSLEYFKGDSEQRAAFFNVIASKKLTETVESIFGSGIVFHNTQLFFNPTHVERLPYWHRDLQYSPIDDAVQRDEQSKMLSLHIRIPLAKEKGVELIPGTHKRWDTELEQNVRFEKNGYKNSDPLPGAALIDLALGDVLIFNAQMIHRGHYALNPTRKAFDLCVGKYHPRVSGLLDQRVLPTKAEMSRISYDQWYAKAQEVVANGLTNTDTEGNRFG